LLIKNGRSKRFSFANTLLSCVPDAFACLDEFPGHAEAAESSILRCKGDKKMTINTGLARVSLFLFLSMALCGSTAFADDDAVINGPLTCRIEYWSVGHLGERDDDGWLLAWKANVTGDLNGELRYWFPETPPAPEGKYAGGEVGYYLARWELWDDEALILAGESAGKTVIPDGEDGIWDGHGIVMKTSGDLSPLMGHRIYETGTVILPSDPAAQSTGSGMFLIY
jgi:hypothetical protein